MQKSPRPALRSIAAALLTLLAMFAASCTSAERPVLTTDRLEDVAEPTPTVVVAAPEPTTASATSAEQDSPDPTPEPAISNDNPAPVEVEELVVEVLESFPHDQNAFTQGLELHDGQFIESTGLRGESDLRRVNPTTGEVLQSVATPNDYFAEGVTKVGDELIQITWQENTAFYWDATTFELNREVGYQGEGWGICFDGDRLIMTDGTPVLIFRDPATFAETSRIPVTLQGEEVFNLNEVECVNGVVWANIWQTDVIVRIDPATGTVTGVVDASSLEGPEGPAGAVLNGIAWDPTTSTFLVTGKLWPTLFRVNFVAAPTS